MVVAPKDRRAMEAPSTLAAAWVQQVLLCCLEFALKTLLDAFIIWNTLIHIETIHPVVSTGSSVCPSEYTETFQLKCDLHIKTEIKDSETRGYKQNRYKTKLTRKKSVLLFCLSCSSLRICFIVIILTCCTVRIL